MNITLTQSTLERVITQSSRLIWVMDMQGHILWMSNDAVRFCGIDENPMQYQKIDEVPLFKQNERFREFIDINNPLDRIISILVEGRSVVCRKEHVLDQQQIVCSVISDHTRGAVDELSLPGQTTSEEPGEALFWGDSKDLLHNDIADQVNQTLTVMGKTIDVDRAYIFQFDWSDETMSNTHEWCAQGVTPEIENLQKLPNSTFPWWQKNLLLHRPIIIDTLDQFPEEASEEKMILEMQGIQSIMVFPIVSKDTLYGFMGFDSVGRKRKWEDNEIEFLKMYSRLVATMIENNRLMRNIIEGSMRNQELVDTINMPILILDAHGKILSRNRVWDQIFCNDQKGLDHVYDYIVKEQLGKFRKLVAELLSGEKKHISGVLFSLETEKKEIRKMQLYALSYQRDGILFYLMVFQDVTKLLDYQANVDRLHLDHSQIYLRFSDAFCKLYSGFDFEWTDHYLASRLALDIAQKMGLSKNQMTGLYIATVLQNIGKMMLPKNLLLKSEKLTENEREVVRKYIIDGAEVLKAVEFPWDIARIIREQFEHFDGSGYPKGLIGDEMLKESQIMFVSNMFISLTESQSYREPFSVPEALEMMQQHSSSWYETDIFETLTEIVTDNLGRMRFLKRYLQDINISDYLDFTR